VAAILVRQGDTPRAAPYAARIAVDPLSQNAAGDSIVDTVRQSVTLEEWERSLAEARGALREAVNRRLTSRTIAGAPRIHRDGKWHALDDLTAGRVTVVAFWYRYCEPSLVQLPALARIAALLQSHGIEVITIPTESPTPDLNRFLASEGAELPVYFDTGREAALAMRQYGTPHYFLLESSGTIRLAGGSSALEPIARAAMLLQQQKTAVREGATH
jgi:hypothetical protein